LHWQTSDNKDIPFKKIPGMVQQLLIEFKYSIIFFFFVIQGLITINN